MYNALLTILILKDICTYEEAEAIAEKLNHAVVPAKFKDAYTDVEKILKDLVVKPRNK